jgi:hypothetical protein
MNMKIAMPLFLLGAVCSGASLAAQSNAGVVPPDLSGFWERRDTTGAGSFGAMLEALPRAVLVPGFVAPRTPNSQLPPRSTDKPNPVGVPYVVTTGSCQTSAGVALMFAMTHSSPVDIVQADDEILILPETPGAQRIFMDGRAHPVAAKRSPSGFGHSVGRWEGDTLVVHTVGMTAGGGIPGGGFRTPDTELSQRFRLTDGGQMLTIEYTWTDPKIYQKPHTFELNYHRMPVETYALEEWCDSGDPAQSQSITPPRQDI